MLTLDQYAGKYEFIRFERRDGILQVTFHTEGNSMRWNLKTHAELPSAFADIAQDRDNRIVILTGTGSEFSGPPAGSQSQFWETCPTIKHLDKVHWEGRALLMNLLSIEVPMITALNGPAWRHAEFPLLSDIVLASDTTKIAGAAFVKRLGLEIAAVPYKSNPQAMTDLMGGLVDFIFIDQTSAMQQIKAGKLRALAVASPQRMAEFPAVPTLAEAGVGDFNLQTWLGLLAPGGLPRPVADRLEAAMVKVMSRSSVRERLAVTGQPPGPSSRTVFPAYLKAQREAWSRKAEEAGIQPE